jgi:hypothetical protein
MGVSKFRVNDARLSLYEPPHDRPQRVAISVEPKLLLIEPASGRQLPACTWQMTRGMDAAQGRRETGGVFRDSYIWKAGRVDTEATKGERRRNQWRPARQRLDGLDRDPVPGRGWQQNGRGVAISVMEHLGIDPSPEEPSMRLE